MEELIHDEAINVFKTIQNLGTVITSEALSTGVAWPFMSVPHFEVRGLELNDLSNSLMIGFSPLVSGDKKDAWENYASSMQGWIKEGVDYNMELHKDFMWQVEHLQDISPHIFTHLDSSIVDTEPARIREAGPGPCKCD
jgi:hypothetical protein